MLLRPFTVHISVIALFLHCRMTRSSSPNITLESVFDLEEKNITYRQEIDNDHFHLRKIKRDISKITFSCVAEGPIIWNFECPRQIGISRRVYTLSHRRIRISAERIQHRSELTIYPREFDDRPNQCYSNVSCQLVENWTRVSYIQFERPKKDTSEVKGKIRSGIPIWNNPCLHLQDIAQCSLVMNVDVLSGTYSCVGVSNDAKNAAILSNIEKCSERMDHCIALSNLSRACTNITKSGQIYSNSIENSDEPQLLQCKWTGEGVVAHFLYYRAINHTGMNQLKLLYRLQDINQARDAVLIGLRSPEREYVLTGKPAVFECCTLNSFTPGLFYLIYNGNSTQNVSSELTKRCPDSVNSTRYCSLLTIPVSKNLTHVGCTSTLIGFTGAEKVAELRLDVRDPIAITGNIRSVTESHICFSCNVTGTLNTSISWTCTQKGGRKATPLSASESHNETTAVISHLCLERTHPCVTPNITVTCSAPTLTPFQFHDGTPFPAIPIDDKFPTIYFVIGIAILLFLVIALFAGIVGLVVLFKRRRLKFFPEDACEDFYYGQNPLNDLHGPLQNALLLAYDINFEVSRSEITMDGTVLGSGQFGIVVLGSYRETPVAIKTIRPSTDISYFKALLAELKILQFIGNHPHIVNLVGACTENLRKMQVLLLLDYCENGNLVKFLRERRSTFIDLYKKTSTELDQESIPIYQNNFSSIITTQDLIRITCEVADAMSFIADKQILHGDLAARNVLITESKAAKLSDFGLAKQLWHYQVYVQRKECPLPLRWMAIESLRDMEFSIESDVWSLGVTMWEIFSLAEIPYPGIEWSFESWRMLKNGYRLEKPDFANPSIYALMKECWKENSAERPSFRQITETMSQELKSLQ